MTVSIGMGTLQITTTYTNKNLDVQGNVRIWDATQAEHILKSETRVFSGKVNDLAWDFESKRLIAVGEGKER